MNGAAVVLSINEGNPDDQKLVFQEPGQCLVGRAEDCDLRLPSDFAHSDVSRHHCLFEVDPPSIRVRDLGSRNGTFVNGEMIGQRSRLQPAGAVDHNSGTSRNLHAGDEVRVGITFLRVEVEGGSNGNNGSNGSNGSNGVVPDYCL